MDRPVEQVSDAALRMRRTRERRRLGQVVVYLLLGRPAVAALAAEGHLDPTESDDVGAVTQAVTRHLSTTLFRRSAANV